MKTLICWLLCPLTLAGQISLQDNFPGPNWQQSLLWQGDTANFTFRSGGGLRSRDSTAAERHLFLKSPVGYEGRWQFTGALDFNPSSANFLEFVIMSDRPLGSLSWSGYALRLGGNSDDRWQFLLYEDGQARVLQEGPEDQLDQDSVSLQVKVTRLQRGQWQIEVNQQAAVLLTDSTFWFSAYAGWRLKYTRTRADLFYIDSIALQGSAYPDSLPPVLDSLYFLNDREIKLVFNEPLKALSALDTQRFALDLPGSWHSLSWQMARPAAVLLRWDRAFPNEQWFQLSWQQLTDRYLNDSQGQRALVRAPVRPGDLQINECMPDPSPPVGVGAQQLPEGEYLELLNHSAFPIDLHDLQLQIGEARHSFPHLWLPADSFLVLCETSLAKEFSAWGRSLGQDWSRYEIRNSGDSLLLWKQGKLIDHFHYDPDLFAHPAKDEGGWSLEKIDPDRPCLAHKNWSYSISPRGGTPGAKNSVAGQLIDTVAPAIVDIEALDLKTYRLFFSESLAQEYATTLFTLDTSLSFQRINWWPGRAVCQLVLNQPLKAGALYTLTLSDTMMDCAGLGLATTSIPFGYPQPPDSADLLISEVLFDPPSAGSDFLELYNRSNKLLDLRNLVLSQDPQNAVRLNWEGPRVLLPRQYLALSEDPEWIKSYYPLAQADRIFNQTLPSLPDQGGSVYLMRSDEQLIDQLHYSEKWHLSYLSATTGLSLERSDLSASRKNDGSLWHTAAGPSGGATPGRANSQQKLAFQEGRLSLPYRVFRPNHNGFRDQLAIQYHFDQPSNWAEVLILDTQGHRVRTLFPSGSLAQEGTLWWDGLSDQGLLCPRGLYLILLRYRDSAQRQKQLRLTAVLSR